MIRLARFAAPALLLAACLAFAAAGCKSTTNANGTGNDPVIVAAQTAENSAFDALDAFVAFDDAHRDQLKQTAPSVHTTAEDIRKVAPDIFRSLDQSLDAYRKGKLALTNAIDSVKKLQAQTAAAHAAEKQAVATPK
jgi:opacity protein-like surface antigen